MGRHPTFVHALLAHAQAQPDGIALIFDDGEKPYTVWTWSQLIDACGRGLDALRRCGLKPGDRVVLLGGNDPHTIALAMGAFGGGIIPAIVHPPLRTHAEATRVQLETIVGTASPSLLVVPRVLEGIVATDVATGSAEDLLAEATPMELLAQDPDAAAYLQFSSGTTGAQRAVALSAGAIARNAWATWAAIGEISDDVWVSWLPVYHDMGWVGGVLVPLIRGIPTVLMPTSSFLQQPSRWIRTIDRHRGRCTVAPNFAYTLVSKRFRREALAGIDLSCLRAAFNGAEPVYPQTVQLFEETFGSAGLPRHTVYPVYGLAEVTLSALYWRLGEPIRVDRVSRDSLGKGRADPALCTEDTVEFVSVGRAVRGLSIRVTRPRDRMSQPVEALGEREVGELEVSGNSVMECYWNDDLETSKVWDGMWLRTGDLGYVADGDFFICGRSKDIIKRFGQTVFPGDVEYAAASAPGIKAGRFTCLGIHDPTLATERIWLVVEAHLEDEADLQILAQRVRSHVIGHTNVKVDGVSVVPLGFIEKTSSGKVRRFVVREKLAQLQRSDTPPPGVGRWP